jgi:hypothetical protein
MLVHEREINLQDEDGVDYDRAYVYAESQPGGTWQGFVQFVSVDGETDLLTDRETTQSTPDAVAYWATGLELTYFEGALARAFRRTNAGGRTAGAEGLGFSASSLVTFRLITEDPELPFRLMATRTLTPGSRRYVHNAGLIRYRGEVAELTDDGPGVHEFSAQFNSDAAAAIMANQLWRQLRSTGAILEIDGEEVAVQNGAIKNALVSALYSVR